MRMNNTLLILGRNLVPFNSLLSDCNQAMLIRGMVINNCDLGNLDHHVNVIFLIMRCLNDCSLILVILKDEICKNLSQ
jgi:hypothetical protein